MEVWPKGSVSTALEIIIVGSESMGFHDLTLSDSGFGTAGDSAIAGVIGVVSVLWLG